jgi:CRISPR-associated Csx2 family protein
MWDVFFDHQHTDDDGLLALMEAVPRQAVTPEMLTIHEQRLTEKLGIPVQCLLISYARDEAEQTAILTDLAGAISKGERIVLDVTHGFRHLPMLALVAARYLQHVRGVQVQEVYYGAAEMTDPSSKQTPVLRVGAMLHMLDWVEALAVYENSGNYGVFAPLLQQDGMQADRAHMLAQAAYFERSSNPVQAKQNLSGAHAHVREHQGPMGNLFRDTLTEHIGWFRHGSRADWELALADRYLARQDYLRTITYLCEAYISRATEKFGGNVNQFEDRDQAFKEADKNQDVWLLKHLRNAMTHGVRTDNRDAKRLLQDQQALDSKLRALRKSLFL